MLKNHSRKIIKKIILKKQMIIKHCDGKTLLEITTLHNDMILSTVSSYGFALGFPKRPQINEGIRLLINPGLFPKLVKVGLTPNNPQQFSSWTKYTISLPWGIWSSRTASPWSRLDSFLWSPWTKYTLCSTLFDYTFEGHNLCSISEDFIVMAKFRAWLWYCVKNHDSPQ